MFTTRLAGLCILLTAIQAPAGEVCLRLGDAISSSDNYTQLRAQVYRRGILSLTEGKAQVEVEFYLGENSLGRSRTDAQGIATIETGVRPGNEQLSYRAMAIYKGRHLTGTGRWFTWNQERTIIAVDIDDTVCQTNYGDLFMSDLDHVSQPVPNSAETLRQISKQFYVLYLSARPSWLTDKTREWLDAHGFPQGPVFHRGGWESCLLQQKAKEEILKSLRPSMPNMLIGIADRDVDVRAFSSQNMTTILVRHPELAKANPRVRAFDGWANLGLYFEQYSAGLDRAERFASRPKTPRAERIK